MAKNKKTLEDVLQYLKDHKQNIIECGLNRSTNEVDFEQQKWADEVGLLVEAVEKGINTIDSLDSQLYHIEWYVE